MFLFLWLLILACTALGTGKEVPPGLRPAKAVDDPEKGIVPKLEEEQPQQLEESESAVPTQSGRLDRGEPNGAVVNAQQQDTQEQSANGPNEQKTVSAGDKPLIFQKSGKGKRRLSPAVPGSGTQIVQQVIKANPEHEASDTTAKPTVRTVPPPAGKDYGVNTLLQTNLVDSKGRVLKGVSAVPIQVPDIRNAKASRATASRVETEAEKEVRINFSGK